MGLGGMGQGLAGCLLKGEVAGLDEGRAEVVFVGVEEETAVGADAGEAFEEGASDGGMADEGDVLNGGLVSEVDPDVGIGAVEGPELGAIGAIEVVGGDAPVVQLPEEVGSRGEAGALDVEGGADDGGGV